MRRIALSAAAGVVSLVVVSLGLCQSVPRPNSIAKPTSNVLLPIVQPPNPIVRPYAVEPKPMGWADPGPSTPATTSTGPAAEKMIVKVYSVPDLVAAIHVRSGTPGPSAVNPDLALAMRHVQAQLQLPMAQPGAESDVSDEVTNKLERLKKALRVAAPKKSWTEGGGEGEIEVYPEALSLIVRQTPASHEAIGDLLTQLRATQDIRIELAVEMLSFEGTPDDASAEVVKLLNRDLSADELAQLRKCGGKTAISSMVRLANGRSTNAGMIPEMPMQFTAVAAADRSLVEFRIDLFLDADDKKDVPEMAQALSQARAVGVGKTLAFLISGEGAGLIMLVTPKVITRTTGPAK